MWQFSWHCPLVPFCFRAKEKHWKLVFYRMANFDIRQNSNIRYWRIASILPEYQLFHQNTQFPTRIHNSLPEYQNKLPEYQDKINSFTILRITVYCLWYFKVIPVIRCWPGPYLWGIGYCSDMFQKLSAFCSTMWCLFFLPHGVQCTPHWNLCPTISLIKWGINVKSIMKIHDHSHLHNFSTSGCSPSRNMQIKLMNFNS